MVDQNKRWKTLLDAFRPKKKEKSYRLEELMDFKNVGKAGAEERIAPSEVLMGRSELLYRLEPLIFSGVNKLTRRITGARIFFSGKSEKEDEMSLLFLEESGLLGLLPHLVKDSFIYGFGVAEIIRDKEKKIIYTQLDPKNFDYERDGSEVKLDPSGNIVGFEYRKKGVEPILLKPEQVIIFKFFSLGEFCLGISPVETAFKTSWIKLNLEEALGEAIYRRGYPTYTYTVGDKDAGPWRDITPEKIKQAKDIIKNIDTGSEIVLPWWIKIEPLGIGTSDLGNIETFLEFLSMEILAAFEMPKAFGVLTRSPGGRAVEEMDFEKTILAMQEELKRQIEIQVLKPFYQKNNFKTRPKLNFVEYAPEIQNSRLRRVSAYAKHGLLTKGIDLENELRRREGFPTRTLAKHGKGAKKCIFGLGDCPVRAEEDLPLEKLSAYCNICIKRLKEETDVRKSGEKKVEGYEEREEEEVELLEKQSKRKGKTEKK